jgi:hypothetical protein
MSFNECKSVMDKFSFKETYQLGFFNYVYKKISSNTKNRFVDKTQNSIDIVLSNHPCIKVIPIFKKIDKENLSLDFEVEEASKVITDGEFKYVYFVYPKNENFNKHIEIKIPSLENTCSDYLVKMIPYSLNDLTNTTSVVSLK